MSKVKIKDNSRVSKEGLVAIPRLTDKIANKTLEQLEKEGIFVFPNLLQEANDLTHDQIILELINNTYVSSNIMGFLGLGNEKLIIESRFSFGEHDFLFQYLLEKVFEIPNIIDLDTDSNNQNRIFNLLFFVFPFFLKNALRKGLYKTYIRKNYNNSDVKGTIDIARHIAKNTPFLGNIAYFKREYSFDNYLMELIRHTIEFIKGRPYGYKVLSLVKDEVKAIIEATENYQVFDKRKIIHLNKNKVIRHAYYREYRELQKLCLLILQQQENQLGLGSQQIYGILFDGAWLWEEYINSLVSDIFCHPMNKLRLGAQWLFTDCKDKTKGLIYPDFISRKADPRIIADAKYKPMDNISNKDYLQVLAYMFRFEANIGFYFYPETYDTEDTVLKLNRGLSYEKNVSARDDICLIKHSFKIPNSTEDTDYKNFSLKMNESEVQFKESIRDFINRQG